MQTPANRRQTNASSSTGAGPSTESPQPSSSQAGNPTVNIDIQPDPITYQVEIETRVPLEATAENLNDQMPSQEGQDLGGRPQSMNGKTFIMGHEGKGVAIIALYDNIQTSPSFWNTFWCT